MNSMVAKFSFKVFVLTGFIIISFSFSLPAQEPGFDFGQLGVNVGLVGLIITLVQTLKATIGKNAPGWVFMVITMVLSGALGFVTAPEGSGVEDLIRTVFAYLTAAAWLYNVAKRAPFLKNLFRDGKELKTG